MALRLELLVTCDRGPAPEGGGKPDPLAGLAGLEGLTVRRADEVPANALTRAAWQDDGFDFWAFDRHLDDLAARGQPLCVVTPAAGAAAIARQITTRGQRLAPRRNRATAGGWF